MKSIPYILFQKYINILALEMASPGNRHGAICIDTLSFAMNAPCNWVDLLQGGSVRFLCCELTLSNSDGRIGESGRLNL